MRRLRPLLWGLGGLLALALVAGAWLLWPPSRLEARFGASECRVLALQDQDTGAEISGIEDIAPFGNRLYLSAQDRLAAEAAAAQGRPAPEGGLYRIDLRQLSAEGPLRLARHDTEGFFGPLHPHGLHADADQGKLVTVNRRFEADGARGVEMRVYAIRDTHLEPLRRLPNPRLCAANDLVLLGIEARITVDRAGCPGLDPLEALWPRATGGLLRMGTKDESSAAARDTADALVFANGIAEATLGGARALAVAETRASRVALYRPDYAGRDERIGEIATPGGPDNLTTAPDGRVIAALHPSLPRFALYRFGRTDAAPTRLVALDPETGALETLFDDPAGAVFPGATVGVLTPDGRLVAGSVRAGGLLVCTPS
ncbi:MAG: hypothetical protein ACFBRM_13425 [Pikeienuella sp.]